MAGNKLVEMMQKAAKESQNSATELMFGKVTSKTPLKIKVDNRFEIGEPFIVLTSLVSDFTVDMTVNGQTKPHEIHLGLNVGEDVLLLRTQKGQKYIIIDRMR